MISFGIGMLQLIQPQTWADITWTHFLKN
jgi:hypothetical protein